MPASFRQPLLTPLFAALRAGESAAIVGVSSIGKTRLLDFLFRPEVQQQYLGEAATTMHLVRADANRAAELSEWGLYELLLTALVETVSAMPAQTAETLQQRLSALRLEAVLHKNALLAQRNLETAAHILCAEHGLRLAIVLDEFDAFYTRLSAAVLANLRALRDMVKPYNYGISYLLMLRHSPAQLRDPGDHEGFYELLSRHVLGLQPYTRADALEVIAHAQARRGLNLPDDVREQILTHSGGHGGLIDALVGNVANANQAASTNLPDAVLEECRKIWGSLSEEERTWLSQRLAGMPVNVADSAAAALTLKGILVEERIFSPLFENYIVTHRASSNRKLWLDESKHSVWIGSHAVSNLSAKEFNLMKFLYAHAGEIVKRDDVLAVVYPGEITKDSEAEDNRLDAMVSRLRGKIEPVPSHPVYLLTKPGVGYTLITMDASEREIQN
jgi:DNA-binding winged helix-turn-helix (wHTH) protein